MPLEAYDKWQGNSELAIPGMFIQKAWPESTPEQREIAISGTHPKCFDAMFPDE